HSYCQLRNLHLFPTRRSSDLILQGKTFTADPISKRRLQNLGEEDRYYIHDHHKPIISEEMFARAQEIRRRRNVNRKHGVTPGKRDRKSTRLNSSHVSISYAVF